MGQGYASCLAPGAELEPTAAPRGLPSAATWCLNTKQYKPCYSNPPLQFPLDRGGADTQELDSLEYQVGFGGLGQLGM